MEININLKDRKIESNSTFRDFNLITSPKKRTNVINYVKDEVPKPQGEGAIALSPFDDFFLFTVYSEEDNTDIPMDLTSVGSVYLNFINGDEEIKIKNYENADGIDMSRGQVLFKITKSQARKILSFSNNNFYISAKHQRGSDQSDETVLYVGKFYDMLSYQENLLRNEYQNYKSSSEIKIGSLQTGLDTSSKLNSELQQQIAELQRSISRYESLYGKIREQLDIVLVKLPNSDRAEVEANLISIDTEHKNLSNTINSGKFENTLSNKELENIASSLNTNLAGYNLSVNNNSTIK